MKFYDNPDIRYVRQQRLLKYKELVNLGFASLLLSSLLCVTRGNWPFFTVHTSRVYSHQLMHDVDHL